MTTVRQLPILNLPPYSTPYSRTVPTYTGLEKETAAPQQEAVQKLSCSIHFMMLVHLPSHRETDYQPPHGSVFAHPSLVQ